MVAEFTQAEALDDLLSRLHNDLMHRHQTVSRGYASFSPAVGRYLVSRQYDDDNGALYDDEDRDLVDKVEHAILQIPEPGRSALYAQARSLCLGTSAFTSPRLPADEQARAQILATARRMLISELITAGLI